MINIYCDETCHLENDGKKVMAIGATWCDFAVKDEVFREIRDIKKRHFDSPYRELKWVSVSPAKLDFYLEIVQYFLEKEGLNFRCVVVEDKTILRHADFGQTHDEWYYKTYYLMLEKVIESHYESFNIYLDLKDTRGAQKVQKLHEVLCNKFWDSDHSRIAKIQEVRSHEIELVQLADFLLGAVRYSVEECQKSSAKVEVVKLLEESLCQKLVLTTLPYEEKFNVLVWNGQR